MRKLAEASNLDVWYVSLDVDTIERNLREQQAKQQAEGVAKAAAKAQTKDSMKAFAKLTQLVDGEPRIVSDPPLIVSAADLAQEAGMSYERLESVIHGLFREYRDTLQESASTCWRSSASSMRRARSSAWAASAPVATSACS